MRYIKMEENVNMEVESWIPNIDTESIVETILTDFNEV
jgi:hypothetical protein